MRNKKISRIYRGLGSVLAGLVACGATQPLSAQTVPTDFKAAPDIYKVVAQSDPYRLVEGSWKPGNAMNFIRTRG